MCADGHPADAQTQEGEHMENDPQAGAKGRNRAQTTVSLSALPPIFRSCAGPWSAWLLGFSKRPWDRLVSGERWLARGRAYRCWVAQCPYRMHYRLVRLMERCIPSPPY